MNNAIQFSDFQKLDIRVGTVVSAEVPEWSHWVIKLIVDFGPEIEKRTVFAGMMKFYKPDEFLDKQFPFLINITPKKIGPMGDFSEGMMLAVSTGNNEQETGNSEQAEALPVLLSPWKLVPNGTKVR
ncbi:MAG: methionine--tRNA ligase [bacterium]|nr:methionine--tRNA ligase [bacterium]